MPGSSRPGGLASTSREAPPGYVFCPAHQAFFPTCNRAIKPSITNGPMTVAAIPRYEPMLAEMVETRATWVVLFSLPIYLRSVSYFRSVVQIRRWSSL